MHRASQPTIQVHHRGDRGVDGILRLIELAGHDGPLEAMLTAMCDQLAAITGADIASVYVREDDRLVMRGNHGFPASAIGTALEVGEGITGMVAECMRPISATHAASNAAFKPVPGIGEEQYPVFVGVPLIGGGSAIGVLVLQRRAALRIAPVDRGSTRAGNQPDAEGASDGHDATTTDADLDAFTQAEITLAIALGAPITLAIERRLASALRSARLAGRGHIAGSVLGRAGVVPTPTALSTGTATLAMTPADLERAYGRLRDDLARAMKKLAECDVPAVGAALDRFAMALCDGRLRGRIEAAAKHPDGLRKVAKEYARAPFKTGTVIESAEYAADIEELCVLLAEPTSLKPGAVWIADRVHAFVAIAAVARGAAAIVTSDLASTAALAIARAAGLPVVTDVPGLFGWARASDLLAVDGATGAVLVHPSQTEIEKLRRARSELAPG